MRCFHVWLLVHLPCFPCVCPLFRCLLLFAILAAPSIFQFQFVPLFHCVFHAFLVCVFCPVVSTFPCPPVPPPFLRPLPFPFIFPLCTAPDTCPIFSLRAFRPGTSSSLSSFLPFFLRPWAFRSPYACFQPRCPRLPDAIPSLPAAFPSSFSFVPTFSFPFSPLFSSPSFSIKKKVPS